AIAVLTTASTCHDDETHECKTTVNDFRAIEGTFGNQIRDRAGQIVYICTGEPVTLGWVVSDADRAHIDNGVGDVKVPGDTTTVTPTQDTEYTLTAEKGFCRDSKSVKVIVYGRQARELQVQATLRAGES